MRVRIKDIAIRAGVSTGTVDRVIHNRGKVALDVQEKVEKVMLEMGYRRNIIASTLAYNRRYRVAALIYELNDPYWKQIYQGINQAFEATSHYGVQVDVYHCDQSSPSMFLSQGQEILNNRPDAVLLAPLFLKESLTLMQELHKRNVPVVVINTQVSKARALSYIGQDSYQSGYIAARLMNFGVPNQASALLLNLDPGPTNAQHLVDKERGFRDYFQERSDKRVRILSQNFEDFENQQQLRARMLAILREYQDLAGIFVTNSRAYVLLDCLDPSYLKDLIIVGFDLVEPNIQCLKSNRINFLINQNPVLQGYLGITNLVNYLVFGKEVPPLQFLPLDIVVRENCDYYLRETVMHPVGIF